jgi:hypothetical protein
LAGETLHGRGKHTQAKKRDYIRLCRPPGLGIAERCRVMGIGRLTFCDNLTATHNDTATVGAIAATNSNSMAGDAFAPSCGIEA